MRPLLKKANLSLDDKKLIKRTACDQIVNFASRTGNIEKNQSAYRVGHSTESALLKVKSDLFHAVDR